MQIQAIDEVFAILDDEESPNITNWLGTLGTTAATATSVLSTENSARSGRNSVNTTTLNDLKTTLAAERAKQETAADRLYRNSEQGAWNTYTSATLTARTGYFDNCKTAENTYKTAADVADTAYCSASVTAYTSFQEAGKALDTAFYAAVTDANDANFTTTAYFTTTGANPNLSFQKTTLENLQNSDSGSVKVLSPIVSNDNSNHGILLAMITDEELANRHVAINNPPRPKEPAKAPAPSGIWDQLCFGSTFLLRYLGERKDLPQEEQSLADLKFEPYQRDSDWWVPYVTYDTDSTVSKILYGYEPIRAKIDALHQDICRELESQIKSDLRQQGMNGESNLSIKKHYSLCVANNDAISFWLGTGCLECEVLALYRWGPDENNPDMRDVYVSYNVFWSWMDTIDARSDLPGFIGGVEYICDKIGDQWFQRAYSVKIEHQELNNTYLFKYSPLDLIR